ncbi:hypothetical protein ACJX0J_041026 [Zea mays]
MRHPSKLMHKNMPGIQAQSQYHNLHVVGDDAMVGNIENSASMFTNLPLSAEQTKGEKIKYISQKPSPAWLVLLEREGNWAKQGKEMRQREIFFRPWGWFLSINNFYRARWNLVLFSKPFFL